MIPENQGGFIKGRRIWDNMILVQEAILSILKNGEKGMVVNIDSHTFLLNAMARYGFDLSFMRWVKACISTPWIAPLINERETSFFQAMRGLRQGCLLSPLLYAIQASVLSLQLEQASRH